MLRLSLFICLLLTGTLSQAQKSDSSDESDMIMNLMLVSDEHEGLDVIEDIIKTMKKHEGFVSIKRSDGVFSPMGPSGYSEIIEVLWKNMEMMMDWSEQMMSKIPESRRMKISGIETLIYSYQAD